LNTLVVRFLTRPGCHLCEEALPLVEKAVLRVGMTMDVVDVEADQRLLREYGLRIPVVLGPDGYVLAEGKIVDGRRLTAALRRSRSSGRRLRAPWSRR
jgi:hypothetical protein